MKKTMSITFAIGALILGVVMGYGYSLYNVHRDSLNSLNNSLLNFSNYLDAAGNDLRQSTLHPTTPLGRAYAVQYKVAVAQALAVWQLMSPALIQHGFTEPDIFQINEGLTVISQNILLSTGALEPTPTIKRATDWVSMLQSGLINYNGTPNNVTRLRNKIASFVQKYRSYKSDPNFQVLPN